MNRDGSFTRVATLIEERLKALFQLKRDNGTCPGLFTLSFDKPAQGWIHSRFTSICTSHRLSTEKQTTTISYHNCYCPIYYLL